MNKVVLKEFDKPLIIIDIIFYNLICLVGVVILTVKGMELMSLIRYFYLLFFVLAFISTIAYFANRKPDDYEYLLYAFINVYVGTFALVYIDYKNPWFILGCAMLVYTIANTLNRGLHVRQLDHKNSSNIVVKFAILILISMLSLFVAINLFSHNVIGNEIMGYYLIGFGLISLIEPYMNILIENNTLKKMINKEVAPVEEQEKKEIKPVRKRVVKKPLKEKEAAVKKKRVVKKK